MPLQATSGAASYDAFGGGVPDMPNYIESVFSTYLYTGNSSTQTITNGIDLSGKGGLVWLKDRAGGGNHILQDTVRGANNYLNSDETTASQTLAGTNFAFASSGFSMNNSYLGFNANGNPYASWTFRKQPKFFDVVTYTGTNSSQNVAHNLGAVPGVIIYKRSSGIANWCVLARKNDGTYESFYLNTTGATQYTAPDATVAGLTSTTFDPSAVFGGETNGITGGNQYIAYLFAHNAGGFGLTGTDNVISCGSFVHSIGGFVDLGFEPQWVLTKRVSGVDDWRLFDNMRGMTMGDDSLLNPNTAGAENNSAGNDYLNPQPTGFTTIGFDSGTHIYIAIRRGPMKVPTSGTSVYTPIAYTGDGSTRTQSVGFPTDLSISKNRAVADTSITTYEALATSAAGTSYEIKLDNIVVQLYQIPNTARLLYYRYYRKPFPLANDYDLPDMPDAFHHILIDGCLSQMWREKGDVTNQADAENRFIRGLEDMKRKLGSFAPDRINTRKSCDAYKQRTSGLEPATYDRRYSS